MPSEPQGHGASWFTWLLAAAAFAAAGVFAGSAARARVAGVRVAGIVDVSAAIAAARARGVVEPGRPGAPTLRIFGDYECPACRDLEREAGDTLRALARRGLVTFAYHHAPLRGHRRGSDAAALAYCAAEADAAWAVHRALYESAPRWGTGPDGPQRMLEAAASAGADTARMGTCVRSGGAGMRVAADRSAADALGIAAVPTIYLGNERLRVASWRALVRFVTAQALPGGDPRAGPRVPSP